MVAVRKVHLVAIPMYMSPQKAADHIGIGRTKLLALLKAGHIKAKLINGRRYLSTTSILEYLTTLADAS